MADEYESTDDPGSEESLFLRLKAQVVEDRRQQLPWYKEAKLDYKIKAGGDGQWDEADIQRLDEQQRPHTTFNFIGPSVNSVAGMEVSNRQEVTYLPRTTQQSGTANPGAAPAGQGQSGQLPAMGGGAIPGGTQQLVPGADDTGPAEIFTAAGKYFRDQCDAEDEESDAFQDCATCGVGFTETRIDFDEDPAGKMIVDRCDPLEMGWDHRASKRNMVDARRFHRVREMDKRAALEMFDGHDIDEIDAKWARPQSIESEDHMADREFAYNQGDQNSQEKNTVHVVEITWFETETGYQAANQATGEVMDVDKGQLKTLRDRAKKAGIELSVAAKKKRVFKQAFLGANSILSDEQDGTLCQSQKGFKFNAITGTRDRNKRQWVGIVRAMRDPQRWANALYSSVLNTIMTSGKGVMAERDAFENPTDAERDWANSSKITFLKTGALSGPNPKVVQKVPGTLPPAIMEMMQFAMQSLRDVSGVNVETLGQADTQQAAALDRQRKQAAALSLAPFFDGLRRYRKEQGRIALDLIKTYLSDGRLIRIVGPDYEKYIPLIRNDDVTDFDIIVAESPSSPNQKEASWEIIQAMLPVVGKNMGPNTTTALLRASPMPTTAVDEFKDATDKDMQMMAQRPDPEQQKVQAQMQMMQMDAQNEQQKTQGQLVIQQQKGQADLQIKAMEIELKKLELQLAAFQAQNQVEQARMQMSADQETRQHEVAIRGLDMKAKEQEMQGAADVEMAKNPESAGTLSKGLTALGQAIAELAKATTAPRKTELQFNGDMPVGAVTSIEGMQA